MDLGCWAAGLAWRDREREVNWGIWWSNKGAAEKSRWWLWRTINDKSVIILPYRDSLCSWIFITSLHVNILSSLSPHTVVPPLHLSVYNYDAPPPFKKSCCWWWLSLAQINCVFSSEVDNRQRCSSQITMDVCRLGASWFVWAGWSVASINLARVERRPHRSFRKGSRDEMIFNKHKFNHSLCRLQMY